MPNSLCSTCGTELPADQPGHCPRCGGTARTFRADFSDAIHIQGALDIEHRREYYQKNHRALVVGIVVTVVSSVIGVYLSGWVGLLIGLIIGLISLWFVPSLKTRVIERTRSHYE